MTLREEVGPKQREEAPRASRFYKSYRERVQERCLLDSLLPMSRIFTRRDRARRQRVDWVVFLANHARRGPVFSAPGQLACASMASLVQGGFDEYMVDYGHGPESDVFHKSSLACRAENETAPRSQSVQRTLITCSTTTA